MALRISRWLSTPVVEHEGPDRPFRLRRVSALLLVFGWALFFTSCLLGWWALQLGLPVYDSLDLASGAVLQGRLVGTNLSSDHLSQLMQWKNAVHATCWSGAGMFMMGLFSVLLFDIRDRVPMWSTT